MLKYGIQEIKNPLNRKFDKIMHATWKEIINSGSRKWPCEKLEIVNRATFNFIGQSVSIVLHLTKVYHKKGKK